MAKAAKGIPVNHETGDSDDVFWLLAERQYSIGLDKGKLLCRNPKGKRLASLPAWLKESEAVQQLSALAAWLDEHDLECRHTVERWMLRSLLVPREVVCKVWPDPAWRAALENVVIAPADAQANTDFERMGLLKDIHPQKGLGIVDVDGETQWWKQPLVSIPHPILIEDLDDLRELANDLNVQQAIEQLYRPVYQVRDELLELRAIQDYEGGRFEQLNFALGVCRRLGYPVRGGYATCRVWEGQHPLEARYYVGGEYPEAETETGELLFVGANQQAAPIKEVGPVTFSEGVRMAAAIYAKRKVEEHAE